MAKEKKPKVARMLESLLNDPMLVSGFKAKEQARQKELYENAQKNIRKIHAKKKKES
mgnify:FL=1